MTWPNYQYLFFQHGVSAQDEGTGITFGSGGGGGGGGPVSGGGDSWSEVGLPCVCDNTITNCSKHTGNDPGFNQFAIDCCCDNDNLQTPVRVTGRIKHEDDSQGSYKMVYQEWFEEQCSMLDENTSVTISYEYYDYSGNVILSGTYLSVIAASCPLDLTNVPTNYFPISYDTDSRLYSSSCSLFRYSTTTTDTVPPTNYNFRITTDVSAFATHNSDRCCEIPV